MKKTFLASQAMNGFLSGFTLSLPEWLVARFTELPECFTTAEERMRLILELARRNALEDSGGPFAAGVFEYDTGRLVAVGVNRVVPANCSSAHAEVMALSLAQKRLQAYDLGGPEQPVFELVVNWRPCAMCFGAVLWSGIRRLIIAGSGPELEALTGFDEGPMHRQWRAELAKRGIILTEGVLRREAIDLFRWFGVSGLIVYNARQG
jgi:tRNA(Arg) A34 adenosine deaminase TadA